MGTNKNMNIESFTLKHIDLAMKLLCIEISFDEKKISEEEKEEQELKAEMELFMINNGLTA